MLHTMAPRITFMLLTTFALAGCNKQKASTNPEAAHAPPEPAAEESVLAESAAPTAVPDVLEAALPTLTAFVVDIGQGDASVVLGPVIDGKRKALVMDAGDRKPDGGKIVGDLLKAEGIESLDYLVLSHHDADHMGGFVTVKAFGGPPRSTSLLWECGDKNGDECECNPTSYFPTATVVDPGEDPGSSKSSQEWSKCIPEITAAKNVAYHQVEGGTHLGDELDLGGGFKAVVVAGDGYVLDGDTKVPNANSRNEESVAILITNGETDYLITGDLIGQPYGSEDARVEEKLGEALKAREIDVEILRTGHHGASNATEATFIAAINPEVALISAGDGNTHKHPTCKTLRTLKDQGVSLVLQTEKGETDWSRAECSENGQPATGESVIVNGTIKIEITGANYKILSNGNTSPTSGGPINTIEYSCTTTEGCSPSTSECCKICSSGKPCGDSCIAATSTCSQHPGCACEKE